jgi:hypothetical protein
MELRRALLLGLIPLTGGALIVAAVGLRWGGPTSPGRAPAAARAAGPASEPASLPWSGKPLVAATPAPRPEPAPEKTVAARSEDVRIRSTYQNYRTAIATGNATLEQALRPAVLRERQTSLALAQDDLAKAKTDLDRDVARKVLEAMRR